MNITIAIDSFKGSLSSIQAGNAAAEGIRRIYPDAEINIMPMADGGEGTVQALVSGLNGRYRTVSVTGPLGNTVEAVYGILPDNTAVIEMAAASGITLVPEGKRNPMITTTYGTGELIRDAINQGCRKFITGIGGSATNDGGIGCLQALGFGMLDINGNQVSYGAAGCSELCCINTDNVIPELSECTFHVACDVTNPLYGENGCSAVFGPQKGADSEMVSLMDRYMQNFAAVTKKHFPSSSPDIPGSGAAGGLGFALISFLNAQPEPGIELIIRETGIEELIKKSDIVITGEGCLDAQTAMGKTPAGIAKCAKKYNIPVIAFSGAVKDDANACNTAGIDAYFPVLRKICSSEEAMKLENAYANLSDTAEQVFRMIKIFR